MKELYALSSYALRDLFEIWGYIRQDSLETADRVETELLDKCESLARMPGQDIVGPTIPRRQSYSSRSIPI